MAGETNQESGVEQATVVAQQTVPSTETIVEQPSSVVVDETVQKESEENVQNEDEKSELETSAMKLITEEPRNEEPPEEVPVKEETVANVVVEPNADTANDSEKEDVEVAKENSEPEGGSSLVNGEAAATPKPVASEESSSAPTDSSSSTELPQYLYKAMEQVAIEQGFTAGQFKIEFDVGSNKGDGFIGQMFKAFLAEGDRREVYLCKIPPLNEVRRQQFQSMIIFSRETLAYKTLLPLMFSYQKEKGVSRGEGFFSAPKCYYAECDEAAEESAIIMEDLRLSNYRMWNKLEPVNYEHARLTMQQLGRLHAVSLAMKRDRPAEFEQFKVPDLMQVMMPDGSPFEMMMIKMLTNAKETLEPHETKERAKMQKLIDNMRQEMKLCTDGNLAEPYTVLGHGDCWVNNFMFHYKNGAPDGVILLDWQITRYVSPVLDLSYFLFCGTDEEFRRRHFDEMMSIYYNSLEALLEKLGHNSQEVFPRTAMMRQLRRFAKFGMLMAIFVIPMLCTRNEDLPDMDEAAEKFRETNEMNLDAMSMNSDQVAFRKRMSGVIRDMVRYGYL
uniref:CHK kinase-like domain-containing protein n=1 Tax=Anopheles epiroticus TaxID=199890 RepID=A0A9I3FH68_9DIPT